MKTVILILFLTIPSFAADGVNKRKPKPKPKPRIVKPKVETKVTKPELPKSLLETKYDLALTPEIRPLQPLLDIPIVPTQIVETEVRVFEFEQKKDRTGLLILIGGAVAGGVIAILLNDNPVEVPRPTPIVQVPESKSVVLFGSGLLLLGLGIRWRR